MFKSASTLVAEFSSQVVRAVASGFGNTFSLVYLMISDLPSAIDAGDCGGGGAVNGDSSSPGTTIWIVGITAAVNSMVYCCGVTSVDSSARPSAASAYAICAEWILLKTPLIFSHVSASGRLCNGCLFFNAVRMVSRPGMLRFSLVTLLIVGVGCSHLAIVWSSHISLSEIVFKITSMSAKWARFHTGVRASL